MLYVYLVLRVVVTLVKASLASCARVGGIVFVHALWYLKRDIPITFAKFKLPLFIFLQINNVIVPVVEV